MSNINPRLTLSYRDNEIAVGERWTFAAQIRRDYRIRRDLLLEADVGATWYDETKASESLNYLDYFFA